MQLQGRNLSIEMRGEDVKLLQSELRQLGHTLPSEEVEKSYFGKATRKAVQEFQKFENLPPTGEVDEATAKLINARVDAQQPSEFFITGQVKNHATQQILLGIKVEAFFRSGERVLLTRSDTTNADGNYTIPFGRSLFANLQGQRIQVFFQLYQNNDQLLQLHGNPTIQNLEPANQRVDIDVELLQPAQHFIVRGHIRQSDNTVLVGATVRAFDWDRGGEDFLGAATTNDNGYYEITYTAEQFRRTSQERGGADLIVRVYNAQRQVLATSPRRNNAQREETVDLTVSVWQQPPTQEVQFQPLNKTQLLALDRLAGTTLKDLRTVDRELYQQVQSKVAVERKATILANFATSSQALRDQLQTIDFSLADQPDRSVKQVIFDALGAQQVTAEVAKEAVEKILELERSNILSDPAQIDLSISNHPLFQTELQQAAVFKLAAVTNLPDAKTEQVINLSGNIAAISDEALKALVQDEVLADQEAKDLGLTASLYHIADEQLNLATVLKNSEFASVPTGRLTQVRDLVELNAGDWMRVLEQAEIQPPDGLDRQTYAEQLNKKATDLFPTDALITRVIPKNNDSIIPALERLQPLFQQNSTVFGSSFDNLNVEGINPEQLQVMRVAYTELQQVANQHPGLALNEVLNQPIAPAEKVTIVSDRLSWVNQIYRLNPQTEFLTLDYSLDSPDVAALNFGGLSIDQQRLVLADFKAYQRDYALTNDVKGTQALLAAGYHSAIAVASSTLEAFQSKTGLSGAIAKTYYDNAKTSIAEVTSITTSIIDLIKGGFPDLGVSNLSPSIEDYLRRIDGFSTLFGSQDYCQCEHCQSILSPAAYFVDLMRFVEEKVLENPAYNFTGTRRNHPLNLKVRRPDLWTLELTCKNTNEVIPYLDIINEILENYIATRRGFTGSFSNRAAVEDTVYRQALSTATSSFRQPFLLPLERLNTYLSHFERTRALVARALAAPLPVLTAATLNLSRGEGGSIRDYELITQPNTDIGFLRNLYGIQFAVAASGRINPFNAQEMLKFTGLTRAELGQLIVTRFVQASGTPAVEIRSEKTNSSSVQNDIERIYNLTANALDRIHRFVRLWRHTPWSIPELELILAHLIRASLTTDLNESALQHFVTILELQQRWALPTEQVCALWSEIPQTVLTNNQQSLFDRLFNLPPFVLSDGPLPKNSVQFIHPSFRSAGTPVPADNTLHRLLAGLQVSDEQLSQLITQLSNPLGIVSLTSNNERERGFALTLANLTLLYRHARLIQLLKLSVLDLFQLIRHAGISGNHIATLDHLAILPEFYDWWKSSGFKLDDLGFITRGLVQAPNAYPATSEMATAIINSLQTDKAFQFADTVFAFLPGVTEEQSRQIIAANAAAFQAVLPDNSAFRLSDTFNPATPLTIPAGVSVAEPVARVVLLNHHASKVLFPRIASRLNISAEKVEALIVMIGVNLADSTFVQSLHAGTPTPLSNLLDQLLPLTVLFRNKVFDATALNFVRNHAAIFGIADFNAIQINSVRKVSIYIAFTDLSSQAGFTSEGEAIDPQLVQQVLIAFDPAQKFANADLTALAKILRTNAALISTLLPNLNLPTTAIEALAMLGRSAELAKYLGVDGETLKLIISENYSELARASEAVLSAFRAKYSDEKIFLEKLEPFEDKIRSRKRDALTDFLIRSVHPEFETADDLYKYFLVDVQLEGCARTSRVVAAISSVQLYVHRVLMNLEQDRRDPSDPNHLHVLPTSIPADEWAWRKNYRVWEANRKVFLYPENYIEPELRDNKTPLFEELESTLLQQQINEQNVLDAYARYLSGFEEVAKLKIAGSYHDINYTSKTDLLHLFGVTPGDPPVYYYRTIENAYYGETAEHRGVVYRPWRKIDVQIPVRKVAPIVYLGRLFVFWVEIVSTPKNEVKDAGSQFIGYKHKLTLKYTILRLDGVWTPPQVISLSSISLFSTGDGIIDDLLAETSEVLELIATIPTLDLARIETARAKLQTPKYDTRIHPEPIDGYTLTGFQWEQVYPQPYGNSLSIMGRNFVMDMSIDFYRKSIVPKPSLPFLGFFLFFPTQVLCSRIESGNRRLYYGSQYLGTNSYADASIITDQRQIDKLAATRELPSWRISGLSTGLYTQPIARINNNDEIAIINGSVTDAIIDSNGDLLLLQDSVRPGSTYLLKRLGTTLGEALSRTLFTGGVNVLLDIATQKNLREAPLPISLINFIENAGNQGKLDFRGSFGIYYQEIFFHIPFLIANHLNSQQRFAAAQQWYHYIFNPTANETISTTGLSAAERAKRQRDRVWRYLEFRNLDIPKMREILSDPATIEVYKKDPFNPHAIARLRLSAYQKCIVMKYIDNLLDWGDSLFSQFTMESVNEATLLYVMAADILGPRPAELGDCGEGRVSPKNYATIGPLVKQGSDFLVELETYIWTRTGAVKSRGIKKLASDYVLSPSVTKFYERQTLPLASRAIAAFANEAEVNRDVSLDRTTAARAATTVLATGTTTLAAEAALVRPYEWNTTRTGSWTSLKDKAVRIIDNDSPIIKDFNRIPDFGWSFIRQLSPVFCVPENKELRQYWDRVEDRLYKIRHCMDITGARRQLALFAPEIDPRILVRARAAGLSIEDVLNATSGNLPPYRFAYLIEKAKQHTTIVQGFGAALLSAIEKRDMEELNRLRTVQQQNLLKLTTRIREWEIDISSDAITTLERQQAAIKYRRDYYQGLVNEGRNTWEITQSAARHIASLTYVAEATFATLAAVFHLFPEVGSPFAMKYGGRQAGESMSGWATFINSLGKVSEAVGASAGLEAGFERRQEGWEHQVELANHELNQIEKQLTAARLRKEIAVRSLEIHNKTIEQTEEIFEFYRDRFTNLGFYTWLSTTMQRVYREAYNSSYAMARLAEQAFRFERSDETTPLLQSDYWDASRAGFLAGERLLIDLQNMERRFIETNYRTLEIDQAFSLTQIDPAALIDLRETGACQFSIPEVFFDLFYPGHYRRKIKSVRLTIPCVTGPYTNVSASLKLTASQIRREPQLGAASLVDVPLRRSISVATSTAQNDSGVFEFSFRDERYMPFEGSGAVSSWNLSLPKNFRQFDYQTINDVIIHISYTAEEDELFRNRVEATNATIEGTILNYFSNNSIARVFSLRQDFSSALNQLLHRSVNTPVKIQITDKYIPIFLRGRSIQVSKAFLALKTLPSTQTVNNFQIEINGSNQSGFTRDSNLGNLWAKDLGNLFSTGLLGANGQSKEHTLVIKNAGDLAPATPQPGDSSAIDSDKLLDVLLYVEYKLTSS